MHRLGFNAELQDFRHKLLSMPNDQLLNMIEVYERDYGVLTKSAGMQIEMQYHFLLDELDRRTKV